MKNLCSNLVSSLQRRFREKKNLWSAPGFEPLTFRITSAGQAMIFLTAEYFLCIYKCLHETLIQGLWVRFSHPPSTFVDASASVKASIAKFDAILASLAFDWSWNHILWANNRSYRNKIFTLKSEEQLFLRRKIFLVNDQK